MSVVCEKGSDAKCAGVEGVCCASVEMTKGPDMTQTQKDALKLVGMPTAVGDVSYICAPVAGIENMMDGAQESNGFGYKWACAGSVMIQAFVAVATAAAASTF